MLNKDGIFRSLPTNLRSTLSLSPSSFFRPATADALGSKLLHLISEQRSYIRFMELCVLDLVRPTYEEMRVAYATQFSIEYQLLSLPFEETDKPLTPLQETVRLALYVSAQPIVHVSKPSAAVFRAIAAQLKESVERVDMLALCNNNRELLLWVLFVIAHISKGEEEWIWCVTRISQVVESLGLSTVKQIEDALRGFYHLGESFSATIEEARASIDVN